MKTEITAPLLILPARLGWTLDRSFIYGNGGDKPPTEQVLKFIPALECGLYMAGEHGDIVLDLQALLESVRKPGGYYLLTCECGYADDADIKELIFVQHPSPDTIEWEIDVQGTRAALSRDDWLMHQDGYVRLVFERGQYVDDLRRMVAEAQKANRGVELYELAGRGDYRFVEEILAFDPNTPIVAGPVLPPDSHLEFRLEEDEYCWLDGKKLKAWPPHYFPRWVIRRAFKRWLGFADCGYAGDPNRWYLPNEAERAACDAAGYELAAMLQRAFDESVASPLVKVSYVPCKLPAANKE